MSYKEHIEEFNRKVQNTNEFQKDAILFLQKIKEYKESINDEKFSKHITNSVIESINKIV